MLEPRLRGQSILTYEEMPDLQVVKAIKELVADSFSADDLERRIRRELGYPYSDLRIIWARAGMALVTVRGPRGGYITI